MEIIGYIASLIIGISLGLIGGGGSILTVPVLVYLFHVNPVLATAYSLFIVGIAGTIKARVANTAAIEGIPNMIAVRILISPLLYFGKAPS